MKFFKELHVFLETFASALADSPRIEPPVAEDPTYIQLTDELATKLSEDLQNAAGRIDQLINDAQTSSIVSIRDMIMRQN